MLLQEREDCLVLLSCSRGSVLLVMEEQGGQEGQEGQEEQEEQEGRGCP